MAKDPLVVRTAELAAVLSEWVDKHNGRFPTYAAGNVSITTQRDNRDSYSFSAYYYIMSNIDIKINERTLGRIIHGESTHTQLFIADAILCAIEQSGALADGRIEVLPNPLWNQEAWIAWKAEQGCI